jgi:hypothetical protein
MLQGIDIVDVISEIAASYDPPTGAQHRKTVLPFHRPKHGVRRVTVYGTEGVAQ